MASGILGASATLLPAAAHATHCVAADSVPTGVRPRAAAAAVPGCQVPQLAVALRRMDARALTYPMQKCCDVSAGWLQMLMPGCFGPWNDSRLSRIQVTFKRTAVQSVWHGAAHSAGCLASDASPCFTASMTGGGFFNELLPPPSCCRVPPFGKACLLFKRIFVLKMPCLPCLRLLFGTCMPVHVCFAQALNCCEIIATGLSGAIWSSMPSSIRSCKLFASESTAIATLHIMITHRLVELPCV